VELWQNSNTANIFELLADTSDEIPSAVLDTDKKKARPPPLYIREKNSNHLVNIIFDLIGKDSFHVKETYMKQRSKLKAKKALEN